MAGTIEEKIVAYLEKKQKAMAAVELIGDMDESAEDISGALMRMTRDGRLVFTKKNRYALPEIMGLIPAKAVVLRSGVPIAKPLDGSGEMRISRHGDLRAMHGDLIYVRREKRKRGFNDKCELISVAERAHPTFTAVLQMAERKIEQEPLIVKRGRKLPLKIKRILCAES